MNITDDALHAMLTQSVVLTYFIRADTPAEVERLSVLTGRPVRLGDDVLVSVPPKLMFKEPA